MSSKTQITPKSQRFQSSIETRINISPGSFFTGNLKFLILSSSEVVSAHFALNILSARIDHDYIKGDSISINLSGFGSVTTFGLVKLGGLKERSQAMTSTAFNESFTLLAVTQSDFGFTGKLNKLCPSLSE